MSLINRIMIGGLVVTVVAVFLFYVGGDERAPSDISYKLVSVDRGDVVAIVSATGTLNPLVTVQVGSQVSGNIKRLLVDFNSHVKKNDIIAQIDPSLFEAMKAQATASVRSARAALEKARVAQLNAERQLKRARGLSARNMVSESELDVAQLSRDETVVEYQVQEARVAEAQAALQLAEVNLANSKIIAPIDGVVISRDVDVGQTVAASLQAPTLFTIAQDLSKMQIEADVDEAFIGMLRDGQIATFSVYAYPERVFEGKVVQIRLNPSLEQDVVIYKCIILVDNSDLSLKPGMTATVSIEVDRRENVLKISNSALRYVPKVLPEELQELRNKFELARDETVLWTPSTDGLKPVKVRVGLAGEFESEISGEGLVANMKVASHSARKPHRAQRKWGLQLF